MQQMANPKDHHASDEDVLRKSEKLGMAWRIKDDKLWSPFEAVASSIAIIFVFGFLLGQDHYFFVMELFFPVIVVGVGVLVAQVILRIRAGDPDVIKQLIRRFL